VGEIVKELGKAGSTSNARICRAKITLAAKPVMRKSPYAGMLFNGAGRPINPEDYANTLPASMGGNKTPIVDEDQIFHGKPSWIEEYHSKLMNGHEALSIQAPNRLRRLTIDEALRIQTFPNNYHFVGKTNSIYAQIGNAVPCQLGFAVGSAVHQMLNLSYQIDITPPQTMIVQTAVLCTTA
jgi:DNA (cytosine-5)-methyltransferase 1